jgi:hypothetical protein
MLKKIWQPEEAITKKQALFCVIYRPMTEAAKHDLFYGNGVVRRREAWHTVHGQE